MKKIIIGLLGSLLACTLSVSQAENLVQVYQQALKSDPTYKQARAQMLTDKASIWIARTGYFPVITAQGNYSRTFIGHNTSIFNTGSTDTSFSPWHYNLALAQPIVNFPVLANMQTADYQAQAAGLTYLYARQQLIQRTAKAYFAVLQAYDTLRHDVFYVSALYQKYVTADQKYKVGLSAKTDVYQAQSNYDQQLSAEITDRNALSDSMQNLRAITGKTYTQLAGIKIQVPLVKPNPAVKDSWVAAAIRQNYNLKATSLTAQQAKEQIKAYSSLVLPSLSATGALAGGEAASGTFAPSSSASVGLALNFTFTGGISFAQAAQQRHQYMVAVDALEVIHRALVTNTRNDYLSVIASASAVRADKASVKSARSSYAAIGAGWKVGVTDTNTLLSALSTLYQVLQQHAIDQYFYLNTTIALKLDAGTLSEKDILIINSWLKKNLNVNPKTVFICKGGKLCTDFNILKNRVSGVNIPQSSLTIPTMKKTSKASDASNLHKKPSTTKKLKNQQPAGVKAPSATKKMQSSHLKINEYTLQLFAASDLASAQSYVNSLPVNSHITILHMGSWYKVVYGHYKTHEIALAALNQLKPIYTKDSPWVYKTERPIASPSIASKVSPVAKQVSSTVKIQQVPQVTHQKIYPSGEQTLVQHLQKKPTHNTLPQPE